MWQGTSKHTHQFITSEPCSGLPVFLPWFCGILFNPASLPICHCCCGDPKSQAWSCQACILFWGFGKCIRVFTSNARGYTEIPEYREYPATENTLTLLIENFIDWRIGPPPPDNLWCQFSKLLKIWNTADKMNEWNLSQLNLSLNYLLHSIENVLFRKASWISEFLLIPNSFQVGWNI